MALSKSDFDEFKNLINVTVDEKLEEKLGLKIGETLSDRLKLLPTREEFLSWMDKIMGELKTIREEHIILSGQVARHTEEIGKLQKIHPNNKHLSAI